ncbi:MAG: IS110 family transposase [Actinomycetota bacterium]|nr:IS110 family transposase [Actinomycetota bacterium]
MECLTLRAVLSVSTDPGVIAEMDEATFGDAVTGELSRWGALRRNRHVLKAAFAAASAPGSVTSEVPAAAERASFALSDWHRALEGLKEVEEPMVEVMEELGLAELVRSIDGLSVVGAAAILAETGDPNRFDSPRTWVKHAGLAPRANESGNFRGQTKTSGRGRPALRTAAWRAIWGLLPHNAIFPARYEHLRHRADNPLNDRKARAALGAALLRQLFVVVTTRVAWSADVASGRKEEAPLAA